MKNMFEILETMVPRCRFFFLLAAVSISYAEMLCVRSSPRVPCGPLLKSRSYRRTLIFTFHHCSIVTPTNVLATERPECVA